MAGLVPAIYVFAVAQKQDVDARDEPGHDAVDASLSNKARRSFTSIGITGPI
jgi:hypothetical protein